MIQVTKGQNSFGHTTYTISSGNKPCVIVEFVEDRARGQYPTINPLIMTAPVTPSSVIDYAQALMEAVKIYNEYLGEALVDAESELNPYEDEDDEAHEFDEADEFESLADDPDHAS